MKILKILGFTFMFVVTTNSQNLVQNSSFEDIDRSKSFIRDSKSNQFGRIVDYVYHWSLVFDGNTPDLLSPFCESINKKSPQNVFGFQQTNWGANYMGIACSNKACEYIQGEFSSPLIKGNVYKIDFSFSFADNIRYGSQYVSSIGALLTHQKISKSGQGFLALKPQVSYRGPNLSNDIDWIHVTGLYKALGGEQFIIIGVFSNDSIEFYDTATKELTDEINCSAYYYIDNVIVDDCSANYLNTIRPLELKNIYFELGRSDLDSVAVSELQFVAKCLKNNEEVKLRVVGYTDNTGTEKLNQKLSIERASVVVKYLVDSGVDSLRLFSSGLGSLNPIVYSKSNKKNRRVEFQLFEQ